MNPTNLFTILGRYVKAVDELDAIHSTLDTRRANIESVHNSSSSLQTLDDLPDVYTSAHASIQSAIQAHIAQAEKVITDYDLVTSNLNIPRGSGLDTVLRALFRDMVVNEYYVSPTSPLGVASDPAPTDTGALSPLLTLDGYNSPKDGAAAFLDWDGEETQLVNDGETLIATCTADSYSNGTSIDGEQFELVSLHNGSPYSGYQEGTGISSQIRPILSQNLIDAVTAGFTSWSSNVPSGWTVDSGTAGTDFDQETTETFRNDSSFRIPTSGSGDFQISTTIDASLINPSRSYAFGLYIKTANTITDDEITLTLKDGSTTIKEIDLNFVGVARENWDDVALTIVNIPNTISATSLTIELAGTASGANPENHIYVGAVFLAPVSYYAGLGVMLLPGETPFTVGDDLKLALTNGLESSNGRFQRFFRRAWNFQLPVSGSNLLADTLITS